MLLKLLEVENQKHIYPNMRKMFQMLLTQT